MGEEKRKYTRTKFNCEILYPTLIKNGKQHTYMDRLYRLFAVDLSEAGICLQSNFLIQKDDFLSFYLRIENNIPFKALLKVRWNKISNGAYICGGEFIALKLNEIYLLREFIKYKKPMYQTSSKL